MLNRIKLNIQNVQKDVSRGLLGKRKIIFSSLKRLYLVELKLLFSLLTFLSVF